MGRETRNFRQTNKSRSGNQGARNYSQINREGGLKNKLNIKDQISK